MALPVTIGSLKGISRMVHMIGVKLTLMAMLLRKKLQMRLTLMKQSLLLM